MNINPEYRELEPECNTTFYKWINEKPCEHLVFVLTFDVSKLEELFVGVTNQEVGIGKP